MSGPDVPALALKALPLVIKAIRKLSERAHLGQTCGRLGAAQAVHIATQLSRVGAGGRVIAIQPFV